MFVDPFDQDIRNNILNQLIGTEGLNSIEKKAMNIEIQKTEKKALNEQFEEKCIIMLKIAEAIQFIHTNNIIHSDIKPHNIVINKIYSNIFIFSLKNLF